MVVSVAFAGWGGLPSELRPLVAAAVAAVAARGCAVSVGCALGADALALEAALRQRVPVRVFAVGGPPSPAGAPGFGAGVSAVGAVLAAAAAGAPVAWWAGGRCACRACAWPRAAERGWRCPSLAGRLARRSVACVGSSVGLVSFWGAAVSPGTRVAARAAAARQLPVLGFGPAGGPPPAFAAGCWVSAPPSCSLAPLGGWRWVPASAAERPSGRG